MVIKALPLRNKIVGYLVWISFLGALVKKFCSRTVVYFTLADLLETNKVQELKFRDCHWCILIHFASVYFGEKYADILKLLVVYVSLRAKIRFRSFTQQQQQQQLLFQHDGN